MQFYDFQSDLTKAYPILSETKLILTDNVDPNQVQDIILSLLPKQFSILGTKVKLSLVIVTIIHGIAYWDLLFGYPTDYPAKDLLNCIYDQTFELDDTYDHYLIGEPGICKLSFKVG